MKTLIIHPEDNTTLFLSSIYQHIENSLVISGGKTPEQIMELIYDFDRIILLGHGSPSGLLAVGQFTFQNSNYYQSFFSYIVNSCHSAELAKKKNNLFIFCDADKFMENNYLKGFGTGMFISEMSEARSYWFNKVSEEIIEESNHFFSAVVSKYIHLKSSLLFFEKVRKDYIRLAVKNPIARFNYNRLVAYM